MPRSEFAEMQMIQDESCSQFLLSAIRLPGLIAVRDFYAMYMTDETRKKSLKHLGRLEK